jgi:hypothetical protein
VPPIRLAVVWRPSAEKAVLVAMDVLDRVLDRPAVVRVGLGRVMEEQRCEQADECD